MHSKYVSFPNANQAQVISDLALLLSGSPISALSASCDKINTTLISTVAPGWTLLDSAAPLSGQVVSALDMSGVFTKVARLFAPGATTLELQGQETWNATAHTGTNATYTGQATVPYSATAVNTYWIFATPQSIAICNYGGALGLFEFTRDCDYLKGNTYPAYCVGTLGSMCNTAGIHYTPRAKNLYAAGDLTSNLAAVTFATVAGKSLTAIAGAQNNLLRDATDAQYIEQRSLFAVTNSNASPLQTPILGRLYDVLESGRSISNLFDTYSDGVDTRMALTYSTLCLSLKVA